MTKPDKNRLSPQQERAIELILQGKRDGEVAEAVGVTRQTVNAWRNSDCEFVAELNRRREALWSAEKDMLRALLAEALEVVQEDLRSEDRWARREAAWKVLKLLDVRSISIVPTGPTQPEEVPLHSALGLL